MERDYESGTADTVTMFEGCEVEHSPAHGMKTLFVVGLQDVTEIRKAVINGNIQHIYFGANQSFTPVDFEEWERWESMIKYFLDADSWVTLDLDLSYAEQLHETCLTESRRFIPMISIKLPYIGLFNYNTTLKIDDTGFDATNPGVWCHSLHELMDRNNFTSWDKYGEDKIIK